MKQQPSQAAHKASLTTKEFLVPFILITSLFFLWGFARAILDVLNKHFQNELDISITQSSLIQVTTYLGYFLMAIPAGWFINRHGYRLGVVVGLMLFGIGALLFIPCSAMGTFYERVVYHRLRSGVSGNVGQSLRDGTWSQGYRHQSVELLAVVQWLGQSVCYFRSGAVLLQRRAKFE